MQDSEKYHAKLAIMSRDGSKTATDIFMNEFARGWVKTEIMEFYRLSMDLSIVFGSTEHKRLVELTNKYETQEILSYRVW